MEYVDIYTKNRQQTGRTKLKGEPLDAGEYILIAHLVIFDSHGNMLIQQRQKDKVDWPGHWDITSGGGVMAGESSQTAALRELQEELGIKVDLLHTRPALTVHYPLGFDDYYIVQQDIPLEALRIQQEEVMDARWASHAEIKQMTQQGSFVKYREGFIDLLFSLRNGRGSYDT